MRVCWYTVAQAHAALKKASLQIRVVALTHGPYKSTTTRDKVLIGIARLIALWIRGVSLCEINRRVRLVAYETTPHSSRSTLLTAGPQPLQMYRVLDTRFADHEP